MTVAQLCDHFEQRELPKENTWRSHATKKIYKAYLTRWIRPHWQKYGLAEVRTIQVESWLRGLPLAKSSCAKIRNLMSVLFNHACRYELFDRGSDVGMRSVVPLAKIPITPNLKDFEAVIDVVAFSDKTAEAANTAALQRLIDQRKAMALSIQKANEIITNTTQDSTITNPHVVASVQVQKLLDAWKANPHYDDVIDINEGELTGIIRDLKQTPNAQDNLSEVEYLKTYVAAKEKEENTWANQAQLVKIGGTRPCVCIGANGGTS